MAKTLVQPNANGRPIGPRTEIAASYDRLEHSLAFLEQQERGRSSLFGGLSKLSIKRVFSRKRKSTSGAR